MRIASLTRRLLFASLALISSLPHPALLPTGGEHSHAVSLQFEHGQLHIVLRHHDESEHHDKSETHETPDNDAFASAVGHADHADHLLHALPADSLNSTSRQSAASAFPRAVLHDSTQTPPRLTAPLIASPPPDFPPELAARRTIVLIV